MSYTLHLKDPAFLGSLTAGGGGAGTTWDWGITIADTNFSIISYGTCNFDVDWGDGNTETIDNVGATTTFTDSHTYSTSGSYTVAITLNSGNFRPYYNNNAAGDELVTLGDTPAGWSFGLALSNAFQGSGNLTTVGDIDTSAVTNFTSTWLDCTSLTSFSLINTSSGIFFYYTWRLCTSLTSFPLIDTSSGTIFTDTWLACTGLTSFPLIDTSSGTSFVRTWQSCTSIDNISALGEQYSFPLIDTSSGGNFQQTWDNCNSLTSFPLINVSSGTNFNQTWRNCTSLTTFPANFFDSWVGTPANNCFFQTWLGCSSLTATSVENILNSIAASAGQQNAPATGKDITISYNAGTGTPDITAAVANLQGRGWTITLNGVLQ